MTFTGGRPKIRAAVLDLLADGKERTAYVIGVEISTQFGYGVASVQMEVSQMAQLRNIERKRINGRYIYRRNDVQASAA